MTKMDRSRSHEVLAVVSDSRDVSDSGKVRIGNFSPAFPPARGAPAQVSDSGKVRVGNFTPAFPPSMVSPTLVTPGKVKVGNYTPLFPAPRSK